jgi:Cu+-exporting ATPase
MEVDPRSAAGSAEHEGVTYHFCSAGCREAFEAEPRKYAAAGA